MPVLFLGHGNPMNAIMDNAYTRAWNTLGESMPKPEAIVSVSAHWYLPGTAVTAVPVPRTIHDFGGFPSELYEMQYPAPGEPALAERLAEMLSPTPVRMDTHWGLDHGTWSVLCHVFPAADIPVVQLSIDETLPAADHYEIGRRLAPLRDEGILILGSGNVVHNLHTYAWGKSEAEPFDWALRFEQTAREALLSHDHTPLIEYESLGRDAHLSIPTPEHYLPLIYAAAAADASDPVSFPAEGVDGGSVSMLAVKWGE